MSKFKVGDRVRYRQWDNGTIEIDLYATVLEVDDRFDMVRYEIQHDDNTGGRNKCVQHGNIGDIYFELTKIKPLEFRKHLKKHRVV